MLAATAKIGSKHFIQVEVLQSIRSQLEQLPAKQKTMLDFRDAVAFLYPALKTLFRKTTLKMKFCRSLSTQVGLLLITLSGTYGVSSFLKMKILAKRNLLISPSARSGAMLLAELSRKTMTVFLQILMRLLRFRKK